MAAAAASITAQPATTIQPFPDPDRFIRLPLARFSPHVSKFPICHMRFGNYRSAAILSPQESVVLIPERLALDQLVRRGARSHSEFLSIHHHRDSHFGRRME